MTDVGATGLEDPFEELFARGVTDGLGVPGWPFADSPSRLVLKKISAPSR